MKNFSNIFRIKKQADIKAEEAKKIEIVHEFKKDDFAVIYIDNKHLAIGTIETYSIDGSSICVKYGEEDYDVEWGDPTNIFVIADQVDEAQSILYRYKVTSLIYYENIETDILFDDVYILEAIDGKHKLMIQYEEPEIEFAGPAVRTRRFGG